MEILIVPLITGLIEAIKRTKVLPPRFLPLLSAILGLGAGLVIVSLSVEGAITGLAYGLAATGLYEGVKHVKK
jgi:hypothetical protein